MSHHVAIYSALKSPVLCKAYEVHFYCYRVRSEGTLQEGTFKALHVNMINTQELTIHNV